LSAFEHSIGTEITPKSHSTVVQKRPVFEERLSIVSPEGLPGKEFLCDVEKILASGRLTNGTFVREFEAAAAAYLGVPHCVAVSSCSVGLALTLRALHLDGDVILPSFTFHATAHCALWNNLRPVFVDCDPGSFCISPEAVRAQISPKTSAILAVHVFGHPAPVSELDESAAQYNLPVICDAAHAFGSKVREAHVGSSGIAEVFSFSPTKLVVAGEGGLITTRDAVLAERLRAARNYGDTGNYDPELPGLNGRMSEFHAALALRGLDTLEARIARRNQIRIRYEERLGHIPGLRFQKISAHHRSTCKDFCILVDDTEFGCSRDQLFRSLMGANIEVKRYFWPPVHRQKIYRQLWDKRPLPVTDCVSERILNLPIYSSLRDSEIDKICDAILQIHDYSVTSR
jgi:dTDP-4-amino-4,6-dideoxygalactose transaminase